MLRWLVGEPGVFLRGIVLLRSVEVFGKQLNLLLISILLRVCGKTPEAHLSSHLPAPGLSHSWPGGYREYTALVARIAPRSAGRHLLVPGQLQFWFHGCSRSGQPGETPLPASRGHSNLGAENQGRLAGHWPELLPEPPALVDVVRPPFSLV